MDKADIRTNEDLGYDSFFESSRNERGLSDFPVARVITESKEAYKVINADGEYVARVTGKRMFKAVSREDYPAVGDWVVIDDLDGEHAVIRDILPRKSIIKRRSGDRNRSGEKTDMQVIAANIDVAFIVESVDRDYSLNRFERYFAIIEAGGAKPAIILNKIDLLSKEELHERLVQIKGRFPDADIISTSAKKNEGLSELKGYIAKGKTYCFLGSSGVGKSSLINDIIGENAIRTGEISAYSGRGKHITTNRQMYFLRNGGIVIDNPGVREVGMTDLGGGVGPAFDEIESYALACKYADCTHVHEPGCGVIDAVRKGQLDEERYSNYIGLKKETEYYEMNGAEKRERDRQGGKSLKKAKKDLRDVGHKDY